MRRPISRRGGWPFKGPPNCAFELNTASPQAKGLVAWWPTLAVRSGTVLRDYAGTHDATITGATQANTGKLGRVLSFDGANDHRWTASDNTAFDPAGAFSVAIWVQSDLTAQDRVIFQKYDAVSTDGYAMWIQNSPNLWEWNVWVGGAKSTARSNSVPTTAWTFLVGVRNTSGTLILYVDGIAQTTTAAGAGAIDSSDDLTFGTDWLSAKDWDGMMGDTRYYSRCLSAAEVWDQYVNRWELYKPLVPFWEVAVTAAPAGAIMNQIQSGNLGADLYNGALI